MKRLAAVLLVLVSACACKNKPDTGPGDGSGTGTGTASTCDDIKDHVDGLYRADATAAKLEHVDETVADNVAMVMTDCAATPAKVAPCASKARTVAELEQRCLIPLDDEGSEGDAFQ